MIDIIQDYIGKYSPQIQTLFAEIKELIIKSTPVKIDKLIINI